MNQLLIKIGEYDRIRDKVTEIEALESKRVELCKTLIVLGFFSEKFTAAGDKDNDDLALKIDVLREENGRLNRELAAEKENKSSMTASMKDVGLRSVNTAPKAKAKAKAKTSYKPITSNPIVGQNRKQNNKTITAITGSSDHTLFSLLDDSPLKMEPTKPTKEFVKPAKPAAQKSLKQSSTPAPRPVSSKSGKKVFLKKKVNSSSVKRLLDDDDDDDDESNDNKELDFSFTQLTTKRFKVNDTPVAKVRLLDRLGGISPLKNSRSLFEV